jgi:hypothetical protein
MTGLTVARQLLNSQKQLDPIVRALDGRAGAIAGPPELARQLRQADGYFAEVSDTLAISLPPRRRSPCAPG